MSDEAWSANTNELQAWVVNLQTGRPNAAVPTLRKIIGKVERFAASAGSSIWTTWSRTP